MASLLTSKLGMQSVRKAPFIKRSLFVWVIVLGLMSIIYFQQFVIVAYNATQNPVYPMAGFGILAVLIAIWTGVEKLLNKPNDLSYTVRASSLLIFVALLAGFASWQAGKLHLENGLITTQAEQLFTQSAQIFGWPFLLVSTVLAIIGFVELWRFLIPFVVLSSIAIFFTFGIFGAVFHITWIIIAFAIAVFGGVVWIVQQIQSRNAAALRWMWIGLASGVVAWIPASAAIAKIGSALDQQIQPVESLAQDCIADQFIPLYAGKKPTDYIPGILELKLGDAVQFSDTKLLSTVSEAGVVNAKIGKRVIGDTSGPSQYTTAVYLEVPSQQTVEAACILHKRNKNNLFGQIELLTKTQLCQLSLKKDREIAEYGQILCDHQAPGWDKDYFEF